MPERKYKYADPNKMTVIHPDQQQWVMNYHGKGTDIHELFERRSQALQAGEKFWNDIHDQEMKETAEERSKKGGNNGTR